MRPHWLHMGLTLGLLGWLGLTGPARAQDPDPRDWPAVVASAQGQEVYFHAWGGEPRINAFLDWVAGVALERHGVILRHVKVGDTVESVTRIVAEREAGNTAAGSVDLLWVNGENFAALKAAGLLFGPWAEQLPHFALVDAEQFPEMREDFSVPVEGLESPWTRAQLVFYYDSAEIDAPPRSIAELLEWAQQHPSEFTYPRPPAFLGTTFLKQALLELTEDPAPLYGPVAAADFAKVTAPLWAYLDALHPLLLRRGRYFPAGGAELRRLLGDGETTLTFSFSPNEAVTSIANGQLPDTVRTYVLDGGTLSNVSFLAIPFNAPHKAGAMVVANLLLAPDIQAHGAHPAQTGSTTVLALDRLTPDQRAAFEAIDLGPAAVSPRELTRRLREPHTSWVPALEAAWLQRYGAP